MKYVLIIIGIFASVVAYLPTEANARRLRAGHVPRGLRRTSWRGRCSPVGSTAPASSASAAATTAPARCG